MATFLLFIADIAILYVSLVVTLFVRYGIGEAYQQLIVHTLPFSVVFVIWIVAMYIANLYEHRALRNTREFFEALLQATAAATVVAMALFYVVPALGIAPKTNLPIFAVVFLALQASSRYLFNYLLAQSARRHALIIDTSPESLELARTIRDNPQFGYAVAGLVRLGQEELTFNGSDGFTVLDGLGSFDAQMRLVGVDTIVIGPRAYDDPHVIEQLFASVGRGIAFTDLPTFAERLTGRVPLGAISHMWFLENLRTGRQRLYGLTKRVMDTLLSIAMGIPVLAAFPFIAFAIKLDSPGPILFTQRRTGQHGRPFRIVKFRTMRADAEAATGAVWASEDDPRVTRLGRILRRTRVDELPQLWNIVLGQMSLVGPRAERPELDARLSREIPFYRQRYQVKPGLSGWAQIKYRYGASVQDTAEKLQYDLYYIKNRSLLLDAEIILKTIAISLKQRGR